MLSHNAQKISAEEEKFRQYLEDNALRFSLCRKKVFDEVINAHGHFSAEDLVKIFRSAGSVVSRATIYRSLFELLEAGIIRKTAFGEKHDYYEHIYDEKPHHHARCIRCSDLLEFPDQKEDRVYVPYLENKGFKILGHEMHFYGICKKCSR